MKIEFEAKILDIDVDKIQDKLKVLGAKKLFDNKFRRYVYDIEGKHGKEWIRLRDEGNKVTLTFKKIEDEEKIEGTKEIEIDVSDFDDTHKLIEAVGFKHKAYQENRRIRYVLDGVTVEIDFWPKIPPYLEVEGKSKKEVEDTVKKLGFDVSQTTSVNTDTVYTKYGLDIYKFKELKF